MVAERRTEKVAGHEYRLDATERAGRWTVVAVRLPQEEPFGPTVTAASAESAFDRIRLWLEWRARQDAAIEALQQAEQAYHRIIAGSPFAATGSEGPLPIELQKEALQRLEAARLHLENIRQQTPPTDD